VNGRHAGGGALSQPSNGLFGAQPVQPQASLFLGFGAPQPQPEAAFGAAASGFPQPAAAQAPDSDGSGWRVAGGASPFGSSGGFSMGASDPSKRKAVAATPRRYRAKRK
jgi:hypothetical protein